MTTTARTDIHRPSAPEFDPEAYTFHGVYDFTPEWNAMGETNRRMATVNRLLELGYRFGGGTKGCGHCGANFRYGALMARADVKEMLYVGETCLNGRFEMTQAAFRAFRAVRKGAAAGREQIKKIAAIDALKTEHPEVKALMDNPALGERVPFLASIAGGLVRYGSLTPKQLAAVLRVVPQVQAEIAAEAEEQDHSAEFVKAHPLLAHLGTELVAGIDFLDKMTESLKAWGSLTERQLAATERIIREKLERAEKAAEVKAAGIEIPTEGRVTVTGRVTGVKEEPCDYRGYYDVMTVQTDAGYTVEVTVPAKLLEIVENDAEALIGQRVRFDAQLIAQHRTPGAAWGKRPTKPALLG